MVRVRNNGDKREKWTGANWEEDFLRADVTPFYGSMVMTSKQWIFRQKLLLNTLFSK